jgi:hypothetical protein
VCDNIATSYDLRFTFFFAARPDNPFVRIFLDATGPLLAPLAFLDAGQPRYGAMLEISTLALIALVALAGAIARRLSCPTDRSIP